MFTFYKETNFQDTAIGNIPKDWKVAKLGDEKIIEDIFYGITAKATEKDTGMKILRTTDIKNYSVDWESLLFCEITEKRSEVSKYLIRKGDLIVARAGTIGVSVLVEKGFDNVIFGSYLIKVKLKSDVNPKFIHYVFQSPIYWKHLQGAQGSTLKNINLPLLKSLKIPLPPLPEQKAITEILSTVDEAIQKTEEVITKTERLKKGLMQELLTKGIGHKEFKDTEIGNIPKDWEVVELRRVVKDVLTGATPLKSKKEYWEDGAIPWLTNEEVKDEIINYVCDTKRKVTEKALKETNIKLLPPNSLILSLTASVGKVAINKIPITTNQQFNALIVKDSFIPEFLAYYLIFSKRRIEQLGGLTTFKFISKETIKKLRIALPPLPEQKAIAEILSTIDKKLEIERKEKEKLERIKKAFMKLLLTGRIRIKAKNEE